MMQFFWTSSFWRDFKSILDYFEDQHLVETSLKIIEAIDKTTRFVADFPELGNARESSKPRLQSLKYRLVIGFEKYLLFYRHDDLAVYFVRLLHGSQDLEEVFS